jgi:S1-C subfamily serine protease
VEQLPSWTDGSIPEVQFHTKSEKPDLTPSGIFKRVSPSVYSVRAGSNFADIDRGVGASGSAVAVSDSIVVTNCHVIKGSQAIVLLIPSMTQGASSRTVIAKPLRSDPDTDRCFLRVETDYELNPIANFRSINSLEVGERVYTVGNPKGLTNSLAEGLISGLRNIRQISYIQTSAAVSPGSSGGGLFDAQGALIGVTTFLLRDSQNLNFAIAAEEYWR